MKTQIQKLMKMNQWNVGLLMIGFIFLFGCQKDPNNNTPITTPVAQEDLSLRSFVAVGYDTFRGAYNSRIQDTNYLFKHPMLYADSNNVQHYGYSCVNHLLIVWYGANKNGNISRDTQIEISFSKSIVSLSNLNSQDISMYFNNVKIDHGYSLSDYYYFPKLYELGYDFPIEQVYVSGNWGTSQTLEQEALLPDIFNPINSSSFRLKKLSDGTFHRVFEADYYSYNAFDLIIPVKVRIVLD